MKLRIKIHPNSSQEKIEKMSDSDYEVWMKEKPIDGKANLELIKMLKKYFKKDAEIKSGFSSRNKIVEVG
jgi:uncharacterized protein (TIGR00251 family)